MQLSFLVKTCQWQQKFYKMKDSRTSHTSPAREQYVKVNTSGRRVLPRPTDQGLLEGPSVSTQRKQRYHSMTIVASVLILFVAVVIAGLFLSGLPVTLVDGGLLAVLFIVYYAGEYLKSV